MSLPPNSLIASHEGLTPLDQMPLEAAIASDLGAYKHVVRVEAPHEPVQRTLLNNGLAFDSSPEQRFLAVQGTSGEPQWVEQKQLRTGDRVLVACPRFDTPLDPDMLLVDRPYKHGDGYWAPSLALVGEPVFWQMIGFALADGYFPSERTSENNFRVYAHDRRDRGAIDIFEAMCFHQGIDCVRTEAASEQLSVLHAPFQRWLRDLGFKALGEGPRTVPGVLFRLPAWMREAVLAGFFTARGEWTTHTVRGTDVLHAQITDPDLAQSVLRLFWSVGIAASIEQRGWDRAGNLVVSDVARYQRRTNFLLPYKRKSVTRQSNREGQWDTISNATANHLAALLKMTTGWAELGADTREKILRCNYEKIGLRRAFALELFERVGAEPPSWLRYRHARVDDTREVGEAVRLYDLSATDALDPAYLADFVLTRGARIERPSL